MNHVNFTVTTELMQECLRQWTIRCDGTALYTYFNKTEALAKLSQLRGKCDGPH